MLSGNILAVALGALLLGTSGAAAQSASEQKMGASQASGSEAMKVQQKQQRLPLEASRGSIEMIQQSLAQQGYLKGQADGQWGPETQDAVRQFQQAKNLEADGNLDFQTLQALGIDLNQLASADQGGPQQAQGSEQPAVQSQPEQQKPQ